MQKKDSGKKQRKKEEPYQKYDRAFQSIFEEFREDIGIKSKKDYQLDEKWQYKRPDTIIILEDNFDYSTLTDKTFPCLKEWNTIEFKSCEETLIVNMIPKYIANANLLSCQMLLDKEGRGLDTIGECVSLIIVSSNRVAENIMVNFQPCEFRKGFYIFTKQNYFPVYLIVINDLDLIKPNYPLLLLGNTGKQEELWTQLIEDIKKELNAKNSEKLWSYLTFSIKKQIFQIKEEKLMKKIKELSEENESINKFFDDEFLGKILKKKDDKFLGKILKEKDDKFLGKILKERDEESIARIFDDEMLAKLIKKKGKAFIDTILKELENS